MLLECLFFLPLPPRKIESYESKQNDTLINMYGCLLDKLLSPCQAGPIVSWQSALI